MEDIWSVVGNVIGLIVLFGGTVWVYVDAKALGSDGGRMPGLVNTKPGLWATGVFLLLIVFLPVYLLVRVRYKRLLGERKAQADLLRQPDYEMPAEEAGVWPPPPQQRP